MKLHHVAFWTRNIEKLELFYKKYFHGKVLFRHTSGDFSCVFLDICDGIRIEIMNRSNLSNESFEERTGYSHLSIELNSKEEVNDLTEYFRKENIIIEKDKEQYDDGFYESSIRDPDGNIIELAYVDRIKNPTV